MLYVPSLFKLLPIPWPRRRRFPTSEMSTFSAPCHASHSFSSLRRGFRLRDSFCRPNTRFSLSTASCSPSRASIVSAVNGGVNVSTDLTRRPSLADSVRKGGLEEDGLSYKECFILRCYEVGVKKTATVEAVANLLQEVGCNHAQSVGFSTDGFATTNTMRQMHLIWVTARMHIEIYKYPAWSDVVEIETWCQSEGRIATRRDWIMKDYSTQQVIGRATSKWVMMCQDTRRLQKVSDEVREEYLVFCPREPRLAIPEDDNVGMKKILKLEDPYQYCQLGLAPRRADLDMNRHVNNVAYVGWVLESVPEEIQEEHELRSITLEYRRECQKEDKVDSLTTSTSSPNGSLVFFHLLRLSDGGTEINRGRTEWIKKIQL